MTLANLLIFAGIYAVAVATPGPGIALVISRALGRGLSGLPWFIAGFVVGDLVLMTVAVSGLALVAQTFETAFLVVRVAGALYLLWMAWKIWTAPVRSVEVQPDAIKEAPCSAFLSSLSLTLGNPKAITFFVSVMPLAVDFTTLSISAYLELVVAIIVVITPVLAGWALLADRARRVFRSERALKRLNRGTATVMAGTAVAIVAR
jgi:threonine/homoserine/homoserine lactone efflux protein